MAKNKLDAKNLKCPMPIVKMSQSIKELNAGEVLEVEATDPVFEADVRAWCKKTSNRLLSLEKNNGVLTAIVEKAA